jgi:4-hydroxy-2-oxoheptanedioate aldolase
MADKDTNQHEVFARRLRKGPAAFAAWCSIGEPLYAEILVREGYDCAILDMQHGTYDFESALRGITYVAGAGKPVLVRVPVGGFSDAARMLDAGAAGVIAPMVNTVADAKSLAAFTKYPPMGERSWGPHKALSLTGMQPVDYFKAANDFSLTIAMIETREALAALDDILAVDGIDGVFVGPSDLSIALTRGETVNQLHPEVDAALNHIAKRTKAAGKFASAFGADGKRAAEIAAKGFALVSVSTDQGFLRAGAQTELRVLHGAAGGSTKMPY